MMRIDKLENFSKQIKGKLVFNYDLKKTNWFNIGGKTKAYFKPESLNELIFFLKEFGKTEKLFILGAGSNILINDGIFNGVIIKLGKNFSNISILPNKTIVAGSATTDKNLSSFASENNIGGLEFLSCIPGTIGGAIRMNSGCYNQEISQILKKVNIINLKGELKEIKKEDIKFFYRGCSFWSGNKQPRLTPIKSMPFLRILLTCSHLKALPKEVRTTPECRREEKKRFCDFCIPQLKHKCWQGLLPAESMYV